MVVRSLTTGRIVHNPRPYRVHTATHPIQPPIITGTLAEQTLFKGEPGFYEMGTDLCDARKAGYCCTRDVGHDGDHAAHASGFEQVATWRAK